MLIALVDPGQIEPPQGADEDRLLDEGQGNGLEDVRLLIWMAPFWREYTKAFVVRGVIMVLVASSRVAALS